MGDGDDGGTEHEFFVGGIHAHTVDFRFQSEHIVQNVLEFIPQVFVRSSEKMFFVMLMKRQSSPSLHREDVIFVTVLS